MLKKIILGIIELWYFLLGNIIALFMYDRKYLKGRHFKSRIWGIGAIGWHWTVSDAFARFFFGLNRGVPFPVSPRISIVNPKNIFFHEDDLNNFQGVGNYFQAIDGKITIGKGCWIAPNVGIITTNHDTSNPENHIEGKDIILGEKCWIGMNSVILPGVTLGPNTIVGAGSIVTHSFLEGNCIIVGNPAKRISNKV